jgi:hypothetical protein
MRTYRRIFVKCLLFGTLLYGSRFIGYKYWLLARPAPYAPARLRLCLARDGKPSGILNIGFRHVLNTPSNVLYIAL